MSPGNAQHLIRLFFFQNILVDSPSAASQYTTATDESARNYTNPPRTRFRPSSSTSHRPSSPLQPYPTVRPSRPPSSIASTSSIGIPGSYPRTKSQSYLPPPVKAAPLPPTSDLKDEFDSLQETLRASQQPSRVSTQATKKDAIDEHDVKPPSISLTASQRSALRTIEKVGANGGVRFVDLALEMGYYEEQELSRLSS
jgi:hypothetical protein